MVYPKSQLTKVCYACVHVWYVRVYYVSRVSRDARNILDYFKFKFLIIYNLTL